MEDAPIQTRSVSDSIMIMLIGLMAAAAVAFMVVGLVRTINFGHICSHPHEDQCKQTTHSKH